MDEDWQAVARQFEDLIGFEVTDKQIPSISYALVDQRRLLASGHVGGRDLGHRHSDASVFRIGSLTKMFTAICVMQLVERGLLDLDADIASYIPHFRPANPFAASPSGPFGSAVTLRKLMSHTAGIVREPKSGHYLDAARPPLSATVDELATSTLKEDPSAGIHRYSNAGIAVVGSVIERVTGQSFTDYLTANVLVPVGMSHSASGMNDAIQKLLAPALMWTIDADSPAPVFNLGGSPAGNISSTVPDMARFAICLLRGGFTEAGKSIVSPASLRQMWTPAGQRPAGYGGDLKGYGLCFGTGSVDGWQSVGHSGAVYGYSTQMTILPAAGLGVLMFSTLDFSNQTASYLAVSGLRMALAARRMGTPPRRPPAPAAVAADQLARLPGTYRDRDSGETVEVRAQHNRLYLMGDGVPLEIKPVAGDDFIVDGRIYGTASEYPHRDVGFSAGGGLAWKGRDWQRLSNLPDEPVPAELAPALGEYGPDFNITYLFYRDGRLNCLIEYFCTHACEPLSPGRYRMHGLLYDDEVLELDATDDNGQTGIRVGPMFLARRP